MIGMLLTWIIFSIRHRTLPVNQFHEDESSVMEMEGAGLACHIRRHFWRHSSHRSLIAVQNKHVLNIVQKNSQYSTAPKPSS
jgi:hypothetical protein